MNILKQEEDFEAAISDAKKIREVDPKCLSLQLNNQIIPELEDLIMNKKMKYEKGDETKEAWKKYFKYGIELE